MTARIPDLQALGNQNPHPEEEKIQNSNKSNLKANAQKSNYLQLSNNSKNKFGERRVSDNTARIEERLKLENDYFKDLYENGKPKNHNASILTTNTNNTNNTTNSNNPSKKLYNHYTNNSSQQSPKQNSPE